MKNMFIDPLKNLKVYNKLLNEINEKISPISLNGIIDENIGHITYSLNQDTNNQILLITYNENRAREIYEDIRNFNKNVYYYSHKDPLYFRVESYSLDIANERMNILSKLIDNEPIIIVSYIDAIIEKIISKEIYIERSFKIDLDSTINLEELTDRLIKSGYRREQMIEGVGQFSIRGGIIDIFSPNNVEPYRIELFDDEIDSIRTFDVDLQRSNENLEEIQIVPTKDILIADEFRDELLNNLTKELETSISKLDNKSQVKENLEDKFYPIIESIKENYYMANSDLIKPFIPDKYLSNLFDYINNKGIVLLDEPRRIEERYEKNRELVNMQLGDLLTRGEVLKSHIKIDYDYDEIKKYIKKKQILTKTALVRTIPDFEPASVNTFVTKSMSVYYKKMEMLVEDLNHYMYRGYKIIILAGTEKQAEKLQSSLLENNIISSFAKDYKNEIKSGQVIITSGGIHRGFEYSDIKFIVISEKELYGSEKDIKKSKSKKKSSIKLSDLEIGDYVVHENHGIGQYMGIDQITVQGIRKDYLNLSYSGNDRLYVPIDQMNLIQKYIGAESGKPKINKLSTQEWNRTKYKVKKAVEEMAEDLIELYAKRERLEGHVFPEDTIWQREFEASFPYEETNGQEKSIDEIKEDMESIKPMDRLLCGDVGYGKTEVALRAAFKAVMDNKQVAFLVPTTILAQQHYNTMIERFKEFPIKIEMLSRFRTKKQQTAIVERIRNGTLDIIVGTHRLLSKDIKYKDLGLLIIDEEQRFGVKHKENIKKLKESVDVLTLTATPIPRTLHMSMIGIRDMSVLEDPPEERYPVQTYVVEYNEHMIREAILKEINRGGQVYFVYNKVYNIDRVSSELSKLIPEVKIGVAHGQMREKELEKEMLSFISKEYDVLVCTTIIETGLDIPNVNTIIIYDADKMGLSQLYQLRGRVGRSSRMAYSYFTYEKNKVLTEIAEKRLGAIKDFTEFGSGFKIAMRDLQIRGAGNLLGTAQHGHMEAIGYDLYVKFLNESIRKLKGEVIEERLDTNIDINIDGYIPDYYIIEEEQKIDIYKKIAAIEDDLHYIDLTDELIDRFGDIPKELTNLMDISYIKAMASKSGISEIYQNKNEIILKYASENYIKPEIIHDISKKYSRSLYFDLSNEPKIIFKFRKNILAELKELVDSMYLYKKEFEKEKE